MFYLESSMFILAVLAAIQVVAISYNELSEKPNMICTKNNNEFFISKYKIFKNEGRLLDLKTENLFILKDCIEVKK